MTTFYVEDYEEVTGKKIPKAEVEAKVVTPAEESAPRKSTAKAETK